MQKMGPGVLRSRSWMKLWEISAVILCMPLKMKSVRAFLPCREDIGWGLPVRRF